MERQTEETKVVFFFILFGFELKDEEGEEKEGERKKRREEILETMT